jgi:predicted dehydrogenase
MTTSRRSFLKTAAVAGAAPFILPSKIWAADTKPGDTITMGFVGLGKQSRGLLGNFLGQPGVKVLAVCDVDTTRRENALQTAQKKDSGKDCKAYADFREVMARKDIDAVCIATPDHWHAIITIAALRSGKDVYCEKPLTHNIHEAIEVMKEVEANKRVLQTGSMQRSSSEFRIAAELVRNGVIGKLDHVECQFGGPGVPCDLKEEELEKGLDWNMWIGPGPMRGYSSVLSPRGMHDHFPHWRTYKEYGGGMVCDWGAHHLDIANWGIGADDSGPVQCTPPADAKATEGAVLTYGNGVTVKHVNKGFGVHFFGSEGEVQVNRGKFVLTLGGKTIAQWVDKDKDKDRHSLESQVALAQKDYLKDAKIKLYKSSNHPTDFLDCTKSRQKPNTNEQVGGRSAICCHLMNQAYYNHATLKWDPQALNFAPGSGDPKWLTRDYRAPWSV